MSQPRTTDPVASLTSNPVSRRQLIRHLAVAGFSTPVIASILADGAWAQDATPVATPTGPEILASIGKDPRMIQRGTTLFETPMELIDGLVTPNELFFIRANGPLTVNIDPAAWRLSVTGLVATPLNLSLADLQAMPQRTMTAFLECSGNSRGRFGDVPAAVQGTKWGNGAIGNAEWVGVSVVDVLDQAGIQPGAVDLVSQGGDFAEMQRGLPIEIALNPDVMLVWSMNGADLPNPNGGPVRLLVPGWGGIASTKWVTGLNVIDHAFDGYFNVEDYIYVDENGTVVRPVTTMPVSSVITSPMPSASVAAGAQTIAGYAWSGYGGVALVEVSVDDGATWTPATITEEAGRVSWVRFEAPWTAQAGDAVLRSRATDERVLQQPLTSPWNAKGYLMNEIYAVPVTVT